MPRFPRPAAVLAALVLLGASPPCGAGDDLADRYRETAGRILGRALVDEGG